MDDALHYLATSSINGMQSLVENSQLYFPEEEDLEDSTKAANFNVDEVTLPLIFLEVPSCNTYLLRVRRPQAPITYVLELNQEGNAVTRSV